MGSSVYSATKGTFNKIAQIASNELIDRKIRVNIVSPGPVQREGFDSVVPNEEAKDHLALATALQRLGSPYEIAKAVLFLASDEASFIMRTEFLVGGGYTTFTKK